MFGCFSLIAAVQVAVAADGRVYGMGSNAMGQLGLGAVDGVRQPTLLPVSAPVVDVKCGMDHTILLAADGSEWSVLTAGWSADGQTGTLTGHVKWRIITSHHVSLGTASYEPARDFITVLHRDRALTVTSTVDSTLVHVKVGCRCPQPHRPDRCE